MKIFRFLFTPVFMGMLFVVLAVAMAAATFIENDFGAASARAAVYNARWFGLIFLLLAINLAGQVIVFRLYRREKLTIMIFHLAFIIMVLGAAITRYTGYDGMMHIREGESSDVTFSAGNELVFELADKDGNIVASHSRPLLTASAERNRYSKSLSSGGEHYRLTLNSYLPNMAKQVEESPDGVPVVSFLATRDMTTGENIILVQGETARAGELTIGFDSDAAIMVTLQDETFFIESLMEMHITRMTDMSTMICPADSLVALAPKTVYTIGGYRIVPRKMLLNGVVTLAPASDDMGGGGTGALELTLSGDGAEQKIYLPDNMGEERSEWSGAAGNYTAHVSYGSRVLKLPFSIKLNKFKIERYPGSNSPSGFRSDVTLSDPAQDTEFGYEIYMNHILKYQGYRFYQSSYDKDERGTILSVNHDPAGMLTTYAGYFLLFLFIVLSIINRKSFFRTAGRGYWNSRYRRIVTVTALLLTLGSIIPAGAQHLIIDRTEADRFGEVLAQDQKGRTKPLYTISNDILRKVAKENTFNGLSSMQVFLGYSLDFFHWQNIPLIKVSNGELQTLLGIKGDRAAFADIVSFGDGGGYKLSMHVDKAYARAESERSRFDKEVIKLDERVNICYMMSRGDFLHLFPLRDGTDHWGKAEDAVKNTTDQTDSLLVISVIPLWAQSVTSVGTGGIESGEYLTAIKNYQKAHSDYDLPSESKVKAELFYYKAKIFERLFPYYTTLGLVMIILLIGIIITGRHGSGLILKTLSGLALTGFLFHTLGLGIRWYISGHSPMSNGYESMLFISWVTMLAGFIFSRKSMLTLAATSVLAGMTLMVAHLSFMDPEITNLVPVLKSYWLTLHVSVITGSYGFLGLGAILGLIVMVMMLFVNDRNRENISATIDELTIINYRTLTLGLYFLTIGTFLGAIWANESWGRYWGWDPKETWSLITIVVYTIVTHSRTIPGMKDVYTFNLLSLFAFSSVLMTYFGVNYYLSGLHSYAGGDSVPVPAFVYVAVLVLVSLSVSAWFRYKQAVPKS
ncbi:MAG: c-type cytochrome biogenesis protein CcsB [Bacteroidales bacterium]|nr:c-type cytochrome biogenesis protein CcsB [Bacteroidales bacterium]